MCQAQHCIAARIKLVKCLDSEIVLAEQAFAWQLGRPYHLQITVKGNQIWASADDVLFFKFEDLGRSLSSGGIALVCEEGRIGTDEVSVVPTSL